MTCYNSPEMGDLVVEMITRISLILNTIWGSVRLVEWWKRRHEAETMAITNADSPPQVVNMRGDVLNVTVFASDRTVIEPVTDLARTANDHQVPEARGGDSATGGVCPFQAPSKPEL